MSEPAANTDAVPAWDIADRMRKALRVSGVSIEDMADYIEVSRRSVGNWINGRADPAAKYVRLWALRTGVPYTWLCHGTLEPCVYGVTELPAQVSDLQKRSLKRRTNNMHYSQTILRAV